jgi:PAS domain S-box-containing protein
MPSDDPEAAPQTTDVGDVNRNQTALHESEARLQQVLDTAATGLARCNRDMRYLSANRAYAEIAGLAVDQIVGRPVVEVMGPEAFETIRPHIERVLRGEAVEFESEVPYRAAGPRFIQVVYRPWRETDGTISGWVASVTDITALRNAQEQLRESENRLRAITDNLPIAIALYDRADRLEFANQEYRRLAAKSERAPTGAAAADYQYKALYENTVGFRERARQGESARFTVSRKTDGMQREFEVSYVPYRDASAAVIGVFGMGYDVTELRESHARIRELAERLATVREDERRAVAVTLHERVAQELYAAQLSLRALERKGRGRSGIMELAKELSRVIDRSIEDVRSLTDQLYPTSLVHLPLYEALEQLARQVGKGSGVRVAVDQRTEFPQLNTESRALFFRAAQEALANVTRHAAASNVAISLESDSERIAMVVADDGKGVAPMDLRKPGSLGLLGIRERFATAGGGLMVEPVSPRGTCLTVFLPVRESEAGSAPPDPARAGSVDGEGSSTSAAR